MARRSLPPPLAALLLTSLANLLAASAEAGENRWTPIGLGAGIVHSLAVDPDGIVYAAADIAGIYRSTDAGRTWQWRGAATVNLDRWTSVVIAPDDPQRLYATTQPSQVSNGGVLTSGDGGLHWQELLRNRAGFLSVAVSRNGTLLAATALSEVYRSGDGGRTWSRVLFTEVQSDPPLRVAFDPLAPETAYAGGRAGLWRSTDNGITWSRIGTFPDGESVNQVSALAFPGTRPGFLYALMRSRLYRSEDAGLTWSGGALLLGGYAALAVDPADPETVYASGSVVFVSHDGGDTAAELPLPLGLPYSLFTAIAASPSAPGTLYLSIYGLGVAVSSDAGEHWTVSQQRGLSANRVLPDDFYAAPSGRLYQEARQPGLYFRSLDRGVSWSPLAPIPEFSSVQDLTEEAGAPGRLWAATGQHLFHSPDDGASWRPVPSAGSARRVASPAPGVVLAGSCGLQRSADGGRTWAPSLPCTVGEDGGQASRQIERLGVPHGWPGAVWAEVRSVTPTGGEEFLVLFSQDSGRTWRTLARRISSFGQGGHSVAASRGVIYLNRGAALQRSSDGGATWQTRRVGGQTLAVAVDAADPDIVYVATRKRGVLRSTDGGATWSEANAGLARLGRLWVLDVQTDPKVPFTAYAFPIQGGVFQARLTGGE